VLFLPFLKFESEAFYGIIVFICLCIINEFAGILAKIVSGERRYDGPMGKSDRALLVGIYGILAYLGGYHNLYTTYVFVILIVLVSLSTFLRLKNALKKP
jgi:CDP-diacylglycerol---glycerol-3-phosphate 3-phosphatidyltransferase